MTYTLEFLCTTKMMNHDKWLLIVNGDVKNRRVITCPIGEKPDVSAYLEVNDKGRVCLTRA